MRFLLLISISFIFGLSACGDDDRGSTPRDGAVTVDGSVDGRVPDGGDATIATAALDRYCIAADAFVAQCGDTLDRCDRQTLTECREVATLEREEYIEARAECGFPDACGSAQTFDERLCVHQRTEAVQPTAMQMTLAQALCDNCRPDDATCLDDFFFRAAPRNDGTVVVSGSGASYFRYSDRLVSEFLRVCVPEPGAAMCLQSFFTCIDTTIESTFQTSTVTAACAGPGPDPGA